MAFKGFFNKKKDEQTVSNVAVENTSSVSMNADEVIAVISAAIAVISAGCSTYNLQVKSIRKQGSNSSIWNAVSRKENLDSSF